jgi:hypothetical protein
MAAPDLSWLYNLPGQQIAGSPSASGNIGQAQAGGQFDSASDPALLSQLQQIQQFDPGASITQQQIQQGGGDNQISKNVYSVSYDQSKMPAVLGGVGGNTAMVPAGGWNAANQAQMDHSGSNAIFHQTIDPTQVQNSIYGQLTPGSNVTTQQVANPDTSLLSKLGPAAVGLAAMGLPSLFSGLTAAGAAAGGTLGDLSASAAGSAADTGSSALGSALRGFAQGVPQQLNSGQFNPMSLTGVGGAALGIPSWLLPLINIARNGTANPVSSALTLGGMARNIGGGP